MHLEPWGDEVHAEEKQLRAIERARKWDCAPVPGSLDAQAGSCVFHGDHGDYTVSLEHCDCGAFRQLRNRAPCKHIYRLASELGLIEIQAQEGRSRRDVSEGIFSLSPEAQRFLYEHLRSSVFCVRTPELTEIAVELVVGGFYTEQLSNYAAFADKITLAACGIPQFQGLRNDRRVYMKVLEQLEGESPELLREKLLCLEPAEATINAAHTIEKRFRKKFIYLGMVEDPYTGFYSMEYEPRFDNEVI